MQKIIVANWKMNLSLAQSLKLAREYKRLLKKTKHIVAVCPSEFALVGVKRILKNSKIKLGAQDVSSEPKGSHTGDVSAKTLAKIGCKYVIIGHSEKRAMGETCRMVNLKIKAVLKTKKLVPIICIGEGWDKRKSKKSILFITGQIRRALAGIKTKQQIIIAYEPIWAIGTGKVIKPDDAEKQHENIKKTVFKILGAKADFKVIYGGSVNDKNAKKLLSLDSVDGFLIGKTSLKAISFCKIANIS
ncbi:MAG: triose-phosphate isomerase [bacterium]